MNPTMTRNVKSGGPSDDGPSFSFSGDKPIFDNQDGNQVYHVERTLKKWLCYDQSTGYLTEEEKKIRRENLDRRPYYQEDSMRQLAAAICVRAIRDWHMDRKKLARFDPGKVNGTKKVTHMESEKINYLKTDMRICEEFFDSDLFCEMTGMSGREETIRALEKIPRTYLTILERSLNKK